MKVKMSHFEVEIVSVHDEWFDREDERWFLTWLANAMAIAARHEEGEGRRYNAKEYESAMHGIWDAEDVWDAEHGAKEETA